MTYQQILNKEYLKTRKFWNVLQLLSKELREYSEKANETDIVLAEKVLALSDINRKYLKNCLVVG